MANRYKGEVDLLISDRRFTLRFSTNALASLEEALGLEDGILPFLMEVQRKPAKMASFRVLRAMVWAGIQGDQAGRKLNLEQVGELLVPGEMSRTINAVAEALAAGLPKAQASAEEESPLELTQTPPDGTGTP